MGGGWHSFEFVNWDEAKLPTRSEGPCASMSMKPEWVSYYHGIKIPALASILSTICVKDGGLKESGDKSDQGQRFNHAGGKELRGVYFHPPEFRHNCYDYARFSPCMGDAGYVRIIFEVVADRNYRVGYNHQTQRVQMGNGRQEVKQPKTRVDLFGGPSFYYKSMQVQVCNYRQMPKGAYFELVWNPALESRPPHISQKYGEVSRRKVAVVATPPGYEWGKVVDRNLFAHTELGALDTDTVVKMEDSSSPDDTDACGVADVTMSGAEAPARASLGGPSTLAPQARAGATNADWGEWADVAALPRLSLIHI